jgi:negative regulator of sigma-B (phosphoserine phosphatase)
MESVKSPPLECGVAGRAFPGFSESGDRYVFQRTREGVLVAVVDGLGHGDEAAAAALEACAMLESNAEENVISLIKRCHAGLSGMRGVVASLASFNFREALMTWIGVGNVQGTLLRHDSGISGSDESLLLRPGVVGNHLPPLQAAVLPVFAGDSLIFTTDGVQADFDRFQVRSQAPRKAAENLLAHYAKGHDDALILVARYTGTSA